MDLFIKKVVSQDIRSSIFCLGHIFTVLLYLFKVCILRKFFLNLFIIILRSKWQNRDHLLHLIIIRVCLWWEYCYSLLVMLFWFGIHSGLYQIRLCLNKFLNIFLQASIDVYSLHFWCFYLQVTWGSYGWIIKPS